MAFLDICLIIWHLLEIVMLVIGVRFAYTDFGPVCAVAIAIAAAIIYVAFAVIRYHYIFGEE